MANKERNKRSARKARAQEREAKAAAQSAQLAKAAPAEQSKGRSLFARDKKDAAAKGGSPDKAKAATPAKSDSKAVQKDKKPGFFARVGGYFKDVRTEMGRVIWPSKQELWGYTYAVIIMLVVTGVVLWAVDSGIVELVLLYTGLRP